MKIDTKIKYEEIYLPSKRHRIPRIREVEETVAVELREVKKEDAPVAMVVTDYKTYLDQDGNGKFGLRDSAFLAIDEQLYSEKRDMGGGLDRGSYSFDQFLRDIERSGDCRHAWNASKRSKEDMLQSVEDFVNSHVMIDGVIYQETNEPRYVVLTFGLGHNHGGTGLFVDMLYNENISKDNYFNALQRDEAIAYATTVATRRGDTKSIEMIDKKNIEVLMPEMVRCDLQMEHGNGDPFLNSLEGLVQGSGSVMEAGLLVMSAASTEVSDKKPSLDSQIQSASTRVSDSRSADMSSEKDFSSAR